MSLAIRCVAKFAISRIYLFVDFLLTSFHCNFLFATDYNQYMSEWFDLRKDYKVLIVVRFNYYRLRHYVASYDKCIDVWYSITELSTKELYNTNNYEHCVVMDYQ